MCSINTATRLQINHISTSSVGRLKYICFYFVNCVNFLNFQILSLIRVNISSFLCDSHFICVNLSHVNLNKVNYKIVNFLY